MTRHICGLDISASKVALVLAALDSRLKVNYADFQAVESRGFKRGGVVDVAALAECIQRVINSAQSKSNCKIREVCVNINSSLIKSRYSHGAIALAERTSKVVSGSDILRANNQAHLLGLKLDEEVLHEFVTGYRVDEQSRIKNPLGLYAHKLESELLIIAIDTVNVENIKKVVNQAGLDIQLMAFDGIALSYALLSAEDKNNGCVLIDIGKELTQILIFNEGTLKDGVVLALGSDDIDRALSEKLKVPLELAQDLKKSYAQALSADIKDNDTVMVKRLDSYRPISRKLISSITEEKVKDMLAKISRKLEGLNGIDCVRRGAVFTGMTVLLDGFLETAESVLGLRVSMGQLTSGSLKEQAPSPKIHTYLTAIGLVRFGIDSLHKTKPFPALESGLLGRALNRFKEIYQEYF